MSKDVQDLKILVVEDQPQPMMLVSMVLSDLGVAKVFTANDGNAALEFLNTTDEEVDIIICDWIMPGLSGMDVLQEVRKKYPDTPFIVVTALSDRESIELAKSYGASSYITKPFKPDLLESKLTALAKQL